MEEKSIGQLLQEAREEQHLSISAAQSLSKIKKRYLRALENDDFENIPGGSQARTLLERYAEFLELDVDVILDAYDTGSPLRVFEIETKANRTARLNRRRKVKRRNSFLPLIYLFLLALGIISFVSYTVWQHKQENKKETSSSSYQAKSNSDLSQSSSNLEQTSEASSTGASSDSTEESAQALTINVSSQEGGLVADISNAPQQVKVTLSVTDTSSWIAVSNTELADGVTLSPDNQSVSVVIDKALVSRSVVTLGAVEGVTVKIEEQALDLSSLNTLPSNVVLQFN